RTCVATRPPGSTTPNFCLARAGSLPSLLSFPTRRSSDLDRPLRDWRALRNLVLAGGDEVGAAATTTITGRRIRAWGPDTGASARSEEHTSELQSRFDLVCRLLLEKKKIARTANAIHARGT